MMVLNVKKRKVNIWKIIRCLDEERPQNLLNKIILYKASKNIFAMYCYIVNKFVKIWQGNLLISGGFQAPLGAEFHPWKGKKISPPPHWQIPDYAPG